MSVATNVLVTAITEPQRDYELIDSGHEKKLERFGSIVLVRPDPQAIWSPSAPADEWARAHAIYESSRGGVIGVGGSWRIARAVPDEWHVSLGNVTFLLGLSSFKHTGIFPEHLDNWNWIRETIAHACHRGSALGGRSAVGKPVSVLNLFGYTGGATLAALAAGADVCHVDGSKASIARAKENARLSGLAEKSVRFMLDDALAFVKREARRGNKYDAIIMDPPAFGRGAKGEVWKIERDLPTLLTHCRDILSPEPLFVVLNGYAAGYSPLGYTNALATLVPESGRAHIECGELTIRESRGKRLLPAGIFARWRRE